MPSHRCEAGLGEQHFTTIALRKTAADGRPEGVQRLLSPESLFQYQ